MAHCTVSSSTIIPPLFNYHLVNPPNIIPRLNQIKSNQIKTNTIRFRRAPLHLLLHIAIQTDFPINKVFNSQRDVDQCIDSGKFSSQRSDIFHVPGSLYPVVFPFPFPISIFSN
jgi:hypothetical protein